MTTATQSITAEELLAMGDIGRCELIYGEIVHMSPSGAEHGVVASRFARYLDAFVEDHQLGAVFGAETGFIIEREPDLVRAPDASFVGNDRLLRPLPKAYYPGVPDLAVEVISPGETRRQVAEKVNMWLARGTSVVWEADPTKRTVSVHRTGQPLLVLTVDDVLRDAALLPGFELPLARLYRML